MDRKWMYEISRSSPEFVRGVQDFLNFAEDNRVKIGDLDIWCPCLDCKNLRKFNDISVVETHLIKRGFVRKYSCWSRHGELLVDNSTPSSVSNNNENNDSYDNNDRENLDEMFRILEGNVGDNDQVKLQQIFDDSEKPLYVGCTKFSKLSVVMKLFNLKANNGWSDKSFTSLLLLLHEMLPEDNELPTLLYRAKKLMCPMGLEIERINACPNDCILYRNGYANLRECVTCGTSRYKRKKDANEEDDVTKNGPPAKLLWYFPIIPRLKRLFANEKEAKLLRWHSDEHKKDGKLRHVADSPQ